MAIDLEARLDALAGLECVEEADPHPGRWARSLKQFTCDACGAPIFPCEDFAYYQGTGRVACLRCAWPTKEDRP